MSGVISQVTIVITHIRGLITHIRGLITHIRGLITHIRGLITPVIPTHEPPSGGSGNSEIGETYMSLNGALFVAYFLSHRRILQRVLEGSGCRVSSLGFWAIE